MKKGVSSNVSEHFQKLAQILSDFLKKLVREIQMIQLPVNLLEVLPKLTIFFCRGV